MNTETLNEPMPFQLALSLALANKSDREPYCVGEDTGMPIFVHGTHLAALPLILQQGIRPRGLTKQNNWQHTVGSNNKSVYLTTCYGVHFAYSSTEIARKHPRDMLALLDINLDLLDPALLQCDEDAVEQAMRQRDNLPGDWSMKRRTLYYRARVHHYPVLASLKTMGTCGYKGTIPPAAIRRAVLIDTHTAHALIFAGFDPVISIENFAIMGARYIDAQRWLFGDEETCALNPEIDRAAEPFCNVLVLDPKALHQFVQAWIVSQG